MPLPMLDEFESALKSIKKLKDLNDDNRSTIRDTVGELTDQLANALSLVIIYLQGAKNIRPAEELSTYLRDSRRSLLESCARFKICRGLHQLGDRFNAAFSTLPAAVNLGGVTEIKNLIVYLDVGERSVLESVDDVIKELERKADDYSFMSKGHELDDVERRALFTFINDRVDGLEKRKARVRAAYEDLRRKM